MKLFPHSIASCAGGVFFLLTSPVFAATEATTDPVGFLTIAVSGTTSPGTPKFSLISPTLTQPIVWQGAITNMNGSSITVGGTPGPWSAGQFNGINGHFYVEVSSATKAGMLSDITGTTQNSITTSDNLSSYGAIGDTVRIRKHFTLADFLGANNTAGLLAGTSGSTADEVVIYNATTSASYFYYVGDIDNPAGWYTAAGDPANATVIGPNDGVVVKRKATGDKSIVVAGAAKTGDTLFPIMTGLNVVGTVSAKGLNLDSSGLYRSNNNVETALHAATSASVADEVIIYTASGSVSYFRYTGDIDNPAGWYTAAGDPAGSTTISVGSSIAIKRKIGGNFNWTLPAPSSF